MIQSNIEIYRTMNEKILPLMYPHFITDSGYSRETIFMEIEYRMINTPNNICVMVVSHGDELLGFAIAWTLPNRGYVWLDQAWATQGLPTGIVKEVLRRIEEWTEEVGMNMIRTETDRNIRALERAHGWRFHSYIVQKEI
jgi:hypothetical protein